MATRIKKITIGTPLTTPAATFLQFDSGNVVGIVDSAYIQSRQITYDIDSDYVQTRQITYDVLDSAQVQSIVTAYGYATEGDIDSSFVQARQYTYNLTQGVGVTSIAGHLIPDADSTYSLGSPTNKFKDIYLSGNTINLGTLLLKARGDTLSVETQSGDPANLTAVNYTDDDVLNLIDSAYIQSRQAGLDSAGTTISFRTINIGDSSLVADIVGDEFELIAGNAITLTPHIDSMSVTIATTANYFDSINVTDIVDSNYIQARQTLSTYGDSNVQVLVDSAYVQARQIDLQRDSGFVTDIVDSDYITSRQNLNLYDSSNTIGIVDSAYVQARQTLSTYSDSDVQTLVDSAYVQARQIAYNVLDSAQVAAIAQANDTTKDSVFVTGIIDSAYIVNRIPVSSAYDSNNTIGLVDSAYVQARQTINTFDSTNAISALNGQNISIFTNDAGYTIYDSTNTLGLIDSAYVLSKLSTADLRDKAAVTSFANVDLGGTGGFDTVNLITDNQNILAPAGMPTLINGDIIPFTLLGSNFDLGTNSYKWDKAYIQTLYVGNIIPHLDEQYDIGTPTQKFKTGHFAAETLNLGGLLLSAIEDNEGNPGLGVSNDADSTPPAPIPTQEQVEQTTQNIIANTSLLQDISNVDDSPAAGQTILYDGGTFQWVDYKTQTEIRDMFSAGTGVSYLNGEFSIGQAVGTTDDVTFNDVIVSGDLTVSGTTTTINTEELLVEDTNITVASTATNATQANGAGLTVAGANATLTYASGTDRFEMNKSLATDLVGDVTGTVSDVSNHSTDDISEGSNQYYTVTRARGAVSADGDISYDSSTGVFSYTQPTNVSTFTNDANYLVSADIPTIVDSAYVAARTPEAVTYSDSNVRSLVDSAYVQARVVLDGVGIDSATASAIVTSTVDSAYINSKVTIPDAFDSANVFGIVDSAYINSKVTIPDAFDSANVTSIVTADYITGLVSIPDDPAITTNGSTPSLANEITADEVRSLLDVDQSGTDNSTDVTLAGSYDYLTLSGQQITLGQVDASTDISGLSTVATSGNYNDLSNLPNVLDSAAVSAISGGAPAIEIDGLSPALANVISAAEVRNLLNVDSNSIKSIADDLVAIKVDGLGPTLHPFISSGEVRSLIGAVDSAFVLENGGADSAQIINIIEGHVDSDYVELRQNKDYSALTGSPTALSQFTNDEGFLTSGDLEDIDITSFVYTISGTSSFVSGSDDNSNTLSYTVGTVMVFINGVKQIENSDFTASTGTSVSFTESVVAGDTVEVIRHTGDVLTNDAYISISDLKTIVASSNTYADFVSAVAAL